MESKDFDHEITWVVREDGVLYQLRDNLDVLVKRKGQESQQVAVEMWLRESMTLPVGPLKGDLDSKPFRENLATAARQKLGVEAPLLEDELGWIARKHLAHADERFRELRKEHEGSKPDELQGTPYSIDAGGFVRDVKAKQMLGALFSGGDPFSRISNFVAEIIEELTVDDGAEVRRYYKVRGSVEDRVNLPEITIPASSLAGMNWVTEHWGVVANVAAGLGVKDQVREAIQLYSRGAPARFVYQHTGFRLRGDKRIYLHAGGAIGMEGIEVELQDKLERYALPYHVNESALGEPIQRSLSLLEVAPDRVMFPMLALTYLSPLASITPPDFTLWLWAATGSLKSSLAAVMLSHFGTFDESHLPVDFTATSNYIERVGFLLKDTLCVVDDWRPAVSRGDAAEQDKKAQRLLRAVGNRSGRGRMRSDTSLRHTYVPRGGVIVTAESIPEGPAFESATQRALTTHLLREEIDLARLSELQANRPDLAIAMHGYIAWLAKHYDHLSETLPARSRELREKYLPMLPGSHSRTAGMAASMVLGLEMFSSFALDVGGISEEEVRTLADRGVAAILEACRKHTLDTSGDDPASRFLELMGSLFDSGKIWAKDRESGMYPSDWEELGWTRREDGIDSNITPAHGAKFIGWVDDEFIYLDPDAAYAAVAEFAARGDIPFGIKPRSLWQALKRRGASVCAPNRTNVSARCEGKVKRVVQIPRGRVLAGEDEE